MSPDRRPTETEARRSTTRKVVDFGAANAIVIFHAIVILSGMAVLCFAGVAHLSAALLWALACLAAGGLFGFLFGIPRALQHQPAPARPPNRPTTSPPADGNPPRDGPGSVAPGVNTNLEQISDWLTKIIVGVGLIELRKFPGHVKTIADYVAAGVGPDPDSKTLVVTSLVYFTIMGFIDSYLITRTYLSKVIKEFDDNTISSNDIEVPVGGASLSLTEVSRQVREGLNELREMVVKLHPDLHAQGVATAAGPRFPGKSALWVDDEPANNGLAVEELDRLNIKVDTAETTADALKLLAARPYDLVISDVVRVEGGVSNPKAGINLLDAVRKANPALPFVILTDPANVATYKALVNSTPNLVVTSSRTELVAALHRFFPEPATTGTPEAAPTGQADPAKP